MKKYIGLILVCFVFIFLNQNCADYSANQFEQLASNHSPSILDIDLPSHKARLGDRSFVASTLALAFLPEGEQISRSEGIRLIGDSLYKHIYMAVTNNYSDGSDQGIVDIIEDKILKQAPDFGGPCNFIEKDETCTQSPTDQQSRVSDSSREIIASSTSVREGFRLNACTQLTSNDRAVKNFIFNLTGQRNTAFDYNEHAQSVYHKFYTRPFTDETHEGLSGLYNSAIASGENSVDVWRLIITAVCKSPGWQIP